MICTRCDGTGFLNFDQVPGEILAQSHHDADPPDLVRSWSAVTPGHDVTVCDCCGDGHEAWHGEPGEHWAGEGREAYAYNGGVPECS